jgi:hypothetical protein
MWQHSQPDSLFLSITKYSVVSRESVSDTQAVHLPHDA